MSLPVPADQTHLTHPKYRADIDGLRAIAVLSVVGFHAFPGWVRGGFVGVDIFFVISGFLISSIIISSLEKGTFSFSEFYARRVKRIFPALILVMVACFAFGWFSLLPGEYKHLGKHIAAGSGFISNFIFWQEAGYFDKAAQTKPLLHLWSLGIEEQFYVIWPLLLYFAWKLRFNFLILAVTIVVISFSVNVSIRYSDPVQAFYSPQTRFWELMMGSILAYLTLKNISISDKATKIFGAAFAKAGTAPKPNGAVLQPRDFQSALGVLLIGIAVLLVTKEMAFPGWWALLPTFGTYLIISAGQHAWLNRTLLSHRIVVWFGLISYPLYLWHWSLLSFARIVETTTPSIEMRISAVIISIALAWLTYRLIEKPFRFGKHSKAKAGVLLVLMFGVGYAGYNCYQRDGLGFRFPKIVQEISAYEYDYSKVYREGTCFLRMEQDYSAFDACRTQPDEYKKPSILLWGDSFSAHLYPGYKTSFGNTFNIIQRTASGCPPILDLEIADRPHCKNINDHIFELIKNERPDKIVLAAEWPRYDWTKIAGTITQLRKIGITNIDLIGPVPLWIDSLPKQLYLKYLSDKFHRVPERMNFGLNPDFFEFETLLSDFSKYAMVNYISPKNILCNGDGCITRLGDTGDMLTASDYGHLTEAGSRFLVSKFPHN